METLNVLVRIVGPWQVSKMLQYCAHNAKAGWLMIHAKTDENFKRN